MKSNIIGRRKEQDLLEQIYNSDKSEFVAVCGRRRIGKTFLVKEFFEGKIVFQTSGMSNQGMKEQIATFYKELRYQGAKSDFPPKTWNDIFFMLRSFLESMGNRRKVVLLDELPWMDTPRSGFISALEYFWNVWASSQHNIVLVVCGSSTSWMMDKLINNHGGLHNRLTRQLFLEPFNLNECEEYFLSKNFHLSRYEMSEYYMIFGGVPYYLEMLQSHLSLAQNIDNLLFRPNGPLHNEFDNLYRALFHNSSEYIDLVKALSSRKHGMTRNEIVEALKIKSGGRLTQIINNLINCGFIKKQVLFSGNKSEKEILQLVDFFTLFYFNHMQKNTSTDYWTTIQGKPEFFNWAGNTFKLLVASHVEAIKQKLGISGIKTVVHGWRVKDEKGQSEIDLIIERSDNTANLCEIKFSVGQYEITKDYEKNLRNKINRFVNSAKRPKYVIMTMITTYGVQKGAHSGFVQNEIVLDDLFIPTS